MAHFAAFFLLPSYVSAATVYTMRRHGDVVQFGSSGEMAMMRHSAGTADEASDHVLDDNLQADAGQDLPGKIESLQNVLKNMGDHGKKSDGHVESTKRARELDDTHNPKVRSGWCNPWQEGTSIRVAGDMSGVSYFPSNWKDGHPLSEQECWDKCEGDDACEQAVYRTTDGQCWLGTNTLPRDPGSKGWKSACVDCEDKCFAKHGYGYTIAHKIRPGFCAPWQEGFGSASGQSGECAENDPDLADQRKCSHWPATFALSERGCFAKCDALPACKQAVYSANTFECWIGVKEFAADPGAHGWESHCPTCQDSCYAKHGFGNATLIQEAE